MPTAGEKEGEEVPVINDDFIHLCQPDLGKSCGACCGLYNYANSQREALVGRLRARTAKFHASVRGIEDLPAFADYIRQTEDQIKRYEVIYCCEYLGFLDPEERRVGCLLHPLRHDGVDWRSVSFYGQKLCEGHLCPSYHYLSRPEKLALLHIFDDWYLYGLCLTDIDLVKAYFRLISDGIGQMPPPDTFRGGPLREAARHFFAFKINWPYRSPDVNRLGKYYFDGSQYMINHIDYEVLGSERSRFDGIFLSLSSEFKSREDLVAAERLIQTSLDLFIDLWNSGESLPR